MRKLFPAVLALLLALPLFAWKVQSIKQLTQEGGWRSPIFSPDGSKFFALNKNQQICLFDSGGTLLTMKENTDISLPCWSPDSKKLAAELNSTICILEAENLSVMFLGKNVYKPRWSGDSKSIYCIFWKMDHGAARSELKEISLTGGINDFIDMPRDLGNIKGMAVSTKEAKLAYTLKQKGVKTRLFLVNLENSEKKRLAEGLNGKIVIWSPDGKYIWTGEELLDNVENKIISEEMPAVSEITWSKDSKWLFYSREDGELARFDIAAKKEEVLISKDLSEKSASFSQDGLLAVCLDGKDANLVLVKFVNE
ncbi:MAG: hypothetical protein WCI43_00440 [Candidatus Firestonebacteria bacterium]